MFGKRFQLELEMINNALETELGEKNMRRKIKPYLDSIVDKYISDHNVSNISREKLIYAGWTYFHMALKKYKERTEMMLIGKNNVYYFNTYFNWYIRQGILEYIKSTGQKQK